MSLSKFPALTMEEVSGYREMEFTDAQIEKLNEKKSALFDKTIGRYTIDEYDAGRDQTKELRLLLLGKTGAGKSATGNLIIGNTAFQESQKSISCTAFNKDAQTTIDDVEVTLVDTPGLCDTTKDDNAILTEIAKIFNKFSCGIHGFLFVFGLGNPRFTNEERQAFHIINEAFTGGGFFEHCFMILTHGDGLHKDATLTKKLQDESETPFGQLIADMDNKVIIVDNHASPGYLRDELQKRVVHLVANNVSTPFTNNTIDQYLRDQEKIKEELAEKDRQHAEEIEKQVAARLGEMERNKIAKMSDSEMESTARETHEKLAGDKGIEVHEESIVAVIKAQRDRFTDEGFLGKIRAAWSNFLSIFRS